MSTVREAPSTVKSRRAGSCSLALTINGTPYDLVVHQAEAEGVGRVFRLAKANGESYDVSEHADECLCTCPDFESRRRGLDALGCKHIRSLRALGLMIEPPVFAQEAQEATPAPADAPRADGGPAAAIPTTADLEEMARWSAGDDVEAEADPADWPAWTDADRWEPTLTLPEWIEAEADRYRRLGTHAGELIAHALAELAGLVRFTRATTPETALDRIMTLERDWDRALAAAGRAE